MSLHAAFGLAAQALLIAWLAWKIAARAPSRQSRQRADGSRHGSTSRSLTGWTPKAALFAAVAAALSLVPLADGISAAMALRALWGDPSITTLQLLALSLAGRPAAIGRAQAATLAICGIAFYVFALGVGDLDPYRIGYTAAPLVVVLSGAAMSAWWRGQPFYLWLLAVDLAAYALGMLESDNFWDYLFDPLLVAAAVVATLRGLRR